MNQVDRVIFRTYKKNPKDVFALFPDHLSLLGKVTGYDHRDQHWEADSQIMILASHPCHDPKMYKDLKRELEGRGYHLKIVKRMPRK